MCVCARVNNFHPINSSGKIEEEIFFGFVFWLICGRMRKEKKEKQKTFVPSHGMRFGAGGARRVVTLAVTFARLTG